MPRVRGNRGAKGASMVVAYITQEQGWKRANCVKYYDLKRKEQGQGFMKSSVRLQSNHMSSGQEWMPKCPTFGTSWNPLEIVT